MRTRTVKIIFKIIAAIIVSGVLIWAIDKFVAEPFGNVVARDMTEPLANTVTQELTEPVGISYTGYMQEYDIRMSGQRSEINIIEFMNKKGEHCMVGASQGAPFSMICENH